MVVSKPLLQQPGKQVYLFNMQKYQSQRPVSDYEEKIIQVNRVSKKTKGGNQIGFSVLVVVGDKQGRIAVALGKGPDVLSSIRKGVRKAKKHLITVPLKKRTIPFRIEAKYGAARVLLKPAPPGSGIIAGGAVREVVNAAGIQDVVGKILGSNNQANNAYATLKALRQLAVMCKLKGLEFKSTPLAKSTAPVPLPPPTLNKRNSRRLPAPISTAKSTQE